MEGLEASDAQQSLPDLSGLNEAERNQLMSVMKRARVSSKMLFQCLPVFTPGCLPLFTCLSVFKLNVLHVSSHLVTWSFCDMYSLWYETPVTWVRKFKRLGAIFSAPHSIFCPQNAPDAFSAPIGKLKKTPRKNASVYSPKMWLAGWVVPPV